MGMQYTRAQYQGLEFFKMADEMQGIIEDELDALGREAVHEGQRTIDSAGTGRIWSPGPWGESGTGDRVDSGLMRDAVDYRLVRGRANIGLDVGWPGIYREYFTYQDQGFAAGGFRVPIPVQGIGMISHLSVWLDDKLDAAMTRAIRRIVAL